VVLALQTLAQASWPPDPFSRAAAQPAADSAVDTIRSGGDGELRCVLNGIISGDPPLAMINGMVVALDDRLADGTVVTSIGPDSVTLERPTGTQVLGLQE
jgi:hypothetical protein